MGNNIQIFKNEQFGEIRTVANENNEPLFVANDVATNKGSDMQIQEMQLLTMLMKKIKLPSPFTTAAKTGIWL